MMAHKSSVDGLLYLYIDRCVVAATLADIIGDRLWYMYVHRLCVQLWSRPFIGIAYTNKYAKF